MFTSPVAARALPDSAGVFRGKQALKAYRTLTLERVTKMRFELLEVYAGIDTLVLHYRNQAGGLVSEVLVFDGALVRQRHGTNLGSSAQAGGAATLLPTTH